MKVKNYEEKIETELEALLVESNTKLDLLNLNINKLTTFESEIFKNSKADINKLADEIHLFNKLEKENLHLNNFKQSIDLIQSSKNNKLEDNLKSLNKLVY
jgi:hypothetical protein